MSLFAFSVHSEALCGCGSSDEQMGLYETWEDAKRALRAQLSVCANRHEIDFAAIHVGGKNGDFAKDLEALMDAAPGAELKFDLSKYGDGEEFTWTEHWREGVSGSVYLTEEMMGCGSSNTTYKIKKVSIKSAPSKGVKAQGAK